MLNTEGEPENLRHPFHTHALLDPIFVDLNEIETCFFFTQSKINFSAELVFPIYEGNDFGLKILFVFNLGNVSTLFKFIF